MIFVLTIMASGEGNDIGLICCQLNRMEAVRIRSIIHPYLSEGVCQGFMSTSHVLCLHSGQYILMIRLNYMVL